VCCLLARFTSTKQAENIFNGRDNENYYNEDYIYGLNSPTLWMCALKGISILKDQRSSGDENFQFIFFFT
jgi:hypothetical protein